MSGIEFRPKHLIAATDLSESSVAALRYARMLAERFRAKVTVVYSDPIVYPIEVVGESTGFVASSPEHIERLRGEVEQHVAPVLTGIAYDIDVTTGPPAEMIVRTQRRTNADLIVMGTHGHRGWRRAVLGSVAENVLHTATCPVLTVSRHSGIPAHGPVAFTRVLCPTNFTDVARESLHIAGTLADAFSAELDVVHVVENAAEQAAIAPTNERFRADISRDIGRVCSYREIMLRGGAAERILDYAEDVGADLLVIGAQRQMFRESTVIGTTTERLVRFASCPVLAVTRAAVERSPAKEEGELVTASR